MNKHSVTITIHQLDAIDEILGIVGSPPPIYYIRYKLIQGLIDLKEFSFNDYELTFDTEENLVKFQMKYL